MLTSGSPRAQRGQWSLIGTLVAVAILIALAALYIPRLLKPSGGESAPEQTAMQDANGAACTEYVSQMNQAVEMYKSAHDGQPPHAISDLENSQYGVTADMVNSPGCSFQMDPTTGRVSNGAPTSPGAPSAPGPAGSSSAPQPANGTRGPGGVTIPNIPGAAGGM